MTCPVESMPWMMWVTTPRLLKKSLALIGAIPPGVGLEMGVGVGVGLGVRVGEGVTAGVGVLVGAGVSIAVGCGVEVGAEVGLGDGVGVVEDKRVSDTGLEDIGILARETDGTAPIYLPVRVSCRVQLPPDAGSMVQESVP
jgi:hypothetical protein